LRLFLRSSAQNEVTQELIPQIQAQLFRRNILEPVLASFEERTQGLDWQQHAGAFGDFYAGLQQLLRFRRLRETMAGAAPLTLRSSLRLAPLLAFCKATPGRDPQGRRLDDWLKTSLDLAKVEKVFQAALVAQHASLASLAVPEPVQSYASFREYWVSRHPAGGNVPSYKALSEAALAPAVAAPVVSTPRVPGDRKMNSLFEIASRASTPLALGGLAAAVLFLIFRQIVAKDIFPPLTRAVGADILKLIIDRLFILALLAVVLGFLGYVLTRANSTQSGGPAPLRAASPTPRPPAEAELHAGVATEPGGSIQAPAAVPAIPSSPEAEGRKVLSRERTAGEVLAVLDETPVWDRERVFKDHFKGKWPPSPGWSGAVEGDPRANETGSCDLLVVERGTRTRILARGSARACDARNRDRVTVAGPITAFDSTVLSIRCVEVVIE
jgi:hypothetical protein